MAIAGGNYLEGHTLPLFEAGFMVRALGECAVIIAVAHPSTLNPLISSEKAKPDQASENRGPEYSIPNSRILIIRTPK